MKITTYFSKTPPLSKWVLCTLVISLLSSCQQTKINEVRQEGMLIETQTVDKQTGKKQGLTTMFYPSGKKFMESYYENGVLVGEQKLYEENGAVKEVRHYDKEGVMDGKFQAFYPNGKPKQEGLYVKNVMSGEWLSYHENGSLKERVLFVNGVENGAFIEYHPNGKLATEGTYVDNREHGTLKIYDSTGVLFRQMECVNGACKTTWLADTLKK